jgi:hypothetical protein
VAMDRLWVRIGHLDLVSRWPWLRCYPPVPLFCGRTSTYTSLPLYISFFLFYSFLHIGTPLFGQKSGVSPVFNQLWEPAASSRLVGVPPQGCEIPLRLDPSVRRMDLVPFNYVDRSIVGPQPETAGMGPVVSICNNGGVHRSPPVAPVVTIDSVASVVSASGVHNTSPVVAFRVRHDAGALGLLGNCIQGSSQARYRQGWACWVEFILLYCGTSDFHTLFPEGVVLQSVAMAFVHYLYTDEQRTSQFIDQTLSHVRHYYKIHGRCSDALLSPAVLGVKRAVRIECATLTEDPYPGRKLPFTGDMVAQAILYHRVRQSVGDQLISLAFRCGFSHLLRASEYLNPSGSRLSRHCILAKHVVFQYRTMKGEMGLVSGAELRLLRIPYSMIRVYKITVPSAKNDVYRTGRFHFGSAHRPVDGVDICRELYDHAVSSTLQPSDPFLSWRETSGQRQVLTYAVMRQAVKSAALRLGVDPAKFSLHSLRIGGACALRAAGAPLSMILFMGRWKSAPACLSYQVVGVSEYDRAMDYLRTPGVLSIADVELLHTRFTQSVKYSDTCNDVDSVGFRDGVTCDATADEEEEEDHRAC